MAELHLPAVDFSLLGNLPQTYRAARDDANKQRQEQVRRTTLAELGQGTGPLDPSAASRKLLAAGDLEGAMSLAKLGATDTTDTLKNVAAENKARAARGLAPLSPLEYSSAIRAAGKTTVNVGTGENAFMKKGGELQAGRYDDIIKGGDDAKSMVSDIDALREIGSRITTGKTAEIQSAIGPYAEALGIKIDGLDDMQAYKAITSKMAPRMRVPGSGASSDRDVAMFLDSLPSLGKSPGGNEIVANTFDALSKHKIAAAQIASRALNGEITRQDAEKQIRELPDPLTLWKKAGRGLKPAAGGTTAPPAASVAPQEGQTATNRATGQKIMFKGGQWVPVQ